MTNEPTVRLRARILYWGPEGAGKTRSIETAYRRLRPEIRGRFKNPPTRLDPSLHYEEFEIQPGAADGRSGRIQFVAVPGGPEHAITRKHLLDEVSGIILVLDTQKHRLEDNLASIAELTESLQRYGRSVETIPVVVQLNKTDQSDPAAIQALHRQIPLSEVIIFETRIDSEDSYLAPLANISKQVIRVGRSDPADVFEDLESALGPADKSDSTSKRSMSEFLEAAILAEACPGSETLGEALISTGDQNSFELNVRIEDQNPVNWNRNPIQILSVGDAKKTDDRVIKVPIVLADKEEEKLSFVLTIQLQVGLESED